MHHKVETLTLDEDLGGLSGQRTPKSSDDEKISAPSRRDQTSYKPLAVVPHSKVNFVLENKKKVKQDDLKLLQNNTKKLHRQADSSEDEAEQLKQQPTKK